MGIAVASGAGMLRSPGMHAAFEVGLLPRVAALALHRSDMIRVRIRLDVSMTITALEAAVHAGLENLPVDGDAVPGRILHVLVGVAGEAVRLCSQRHRNHGKRQQGDAG